MRHDTPDPDLDLGPLGLAEDYARLDTPWHQHPRPQLLFAVEGCLRLWSAGRLVVLPPARAAWLPGGTPHRVEAGRPVRLRTVYFEAESVERVGPSTAGPVVFRAPPLLREMAVQACVWGSRRDLPEIAPFYQTFRLLIERWRVAPLPLDLPAAADPALARALGLLLDALDRPGAARPVGVADAARNAGWSMRTLQRRCRDELGVPLSSWLQRARALRGLELLADPRMSVGEAALRCGYESTAAFSRAFRTSLGASPGALRGG